jgi:exodeoxyribonuclease VII small subunit
MTEATPAAAASAAAPAAELANRPFDELIAELQRIVQSLEAGNLPLEESLKVFEEGVVLARRCSRYLDDAERRIEILAKDETGAQTTRPFAWEGEDEPSAQGGPK